MQEVLRIDVGEGSCGLGLCVECGEALAVTVGVIVFGDDAAVVLHDAGGCGGQELFGEEGAVGGGVGEVADDGALHGFVEASEVDGVAGGDGVEEAFGFVGIGGDAEGLCALCAGVLQGVAEGRDSDPYEGDVELGVEGGEVESVVAKGPGDVREVASGEGAFGEPGFEVDEAEAFGDAGGEDGCGGLVDGLHGGALCAVFPLYVEVGFGGEADPLFVGGAFGGVAGGAGDGVLGGVFAEEGEEEKFADVFSADGAGGVDAQALGGEVGGVGEVRERGDGVGQEGDAGESCAAEDFGVAVVEDGVDDVGGLRIEVVHGEVVLRGEVLAEEGVVGGASVFGEVVGLEDEGFAFACEGIGEEGEGVVFAEGMVVDVPEVGRCAEELAGGAADLAEEVFGGQVRVYAVGEGGEGGDG